MSDSMNKNLEEMRESRESDGFWTPFTESSNKAGGGVKGFWAAANPVSGAINASKGLLNVGKKGLDAVTGGRASEQLEATDRATRPTTEETQKAAVQSLEAKEPEKLDYDTSEVENKAKDSINDFKSEVDQSTNKMTKNLTTAANNIDKMNEADAAANASDLSNEISQHDITDPTGRKNIENYLDVYEEMLGPKYEEWRSNYNRALMFTAISQGLSSAFGVGAGIDFTQHPDVTKAKLQLDEMKKILADEKATSGKYKEDAISTAREDRRNRTADQKDAQNKIADTKNQAEALKLQESQKLVDGDIDTANASKAAKAIADVQLANDMATLKQNLNTGEERIEEGKIRKAGGESLSSGLLFEGGKAGADILVDVAKKYAGGK